MKFRESDYDRLYRRLYRLFDNAAPLKTDCGVLCDKACCRGDARTGMLLFPHENTGLKTVSSNGYIYAICDGTCNRSQRPLSCRIFPLFPAVSPEGKIRVVSDLRGYRVCPLVRNAEHVLFSKKFQRRVKIAGRLLLRDESCRAFLSEISAELNGLQTIADIIGEESAEVNQTNIKEK